MPAGHRTIAFGVLARALPAILGYLGADPDRRRRWREAIGADCSVPETAATLLLKDAVRDHRSSVVLFSTTRESRILHALGVAEQPEQGDEPVLDAFRGLVDSERGQLLTEPNR